MERIDIGFRYFGLFAFWCFVLGIGIGIAGAVVLGIFSLSLVAMLFMLQLTISALTVPLVLFGGISALLLGFVTVVLYWNQVHRPAYQILGLILTGVITFFGTLFWDLSLGNLYSAIGRIELWVAIVPAIVVALTALYANHRVTKWYLEWHTLNAAPAIGT